MANWNTTPKWTDFNDINGGEQFSRKLTAEDLNALAQNIAYLYNNAGENEYLGEWEEGVAYKKGAIVRDNGNIYLCIKDADGALTTNTTYWQKLNEGGSVVEDSPLPIKVGSEIEMNALLTNGTVGGVYQYTGTTGTYENGALYVLEEEAVGYNVKILGHGDAGFGYYSLNGGEDIQITSANYVAKYTTMTKELADSKCITLTDVKSLICKMNSGDVTYVTVKDSNFNDVESVLYGDWDDPNYNQVLDVTQYLSEGCYVILWTDD